MSNDSYKPVIEVEEGHKKLLVSIGDRLEKIRKQNGISVTMLCKKVGMSRTTYYRMINGMIYFNTQKFLKILDILNTTTSINFKKNTITKK